MPKAKKNKTGELNNVTSAETPRNNPPSTFRAAGYFTKKHWAPTSDAGLLTTPASAANKRRKS